MSTATVTAAAPEVARFLQIFDMEHGITMKVLKALPADKLDFKPHERNMSARELAWHVANSQLLLATIVATGRFEFEKPPAAPATLPELVDGCESYYQQTCQALAPLTAEQLGAKIALPGGRSVPAGGLMWNAVLFHQIHHRGQLSVYIRMMGGKVPSIYGPSGDENPFA